MMDILYGVFDRLEHLLASCKGGMGEERNVFAPQGDIPMRATLAIVKSRGRACVTKPHRTLQEKYLTMVRYFSWTTTYVSREIEAYGRGTLRISPV